MPDLVKLGTASTAILAGLLIIILWIVAAHDKSLYTEEGKPKCKGCYELCHDALKNNQTDLAEWQLRNKDPYPLLIAFGVICGVFWLGSGAFTYFVTSEFLTKIHLSISCGIYMMFAIVFTIILERTEFAQSNCGNDSSCYTGNFWWEMHRYDSYEEFLGASISCFVLGAYHIAGILYLYATSPLPHLFVPASDKFK